MSVRVKNGSWVVEVYDPARRRKVHVRPSDFGLEPPRNERQAKALERRALNARDARRPGARDETCGSFGERWASDYGARRSASTRIHLRERVASFGDEFDGRLLRSVTRVEARRWAKERPATLPALRAMFNDALEDQLVDENPFARLGIPNGVGRKNIVVLTRAEVERLAELAVEVHGRAFGSELAAMILWGAYTCMRPGETFAARFSLLDGDVYHLQRQFNSRLGAEAAPKHGSVGEIYVPEQARAAVLAKPRRLGDDLIFRTSRRRQFRGEALHRAWAPIRAAFVGELHPGHHLRRRLAVQDTDHLDFYELRHFGASYMLNELELEPWVIAKQLRHTDGGALVVRLYGHPSTEKAIDIMRRAFGGRPAPAPARAADARGTTMGEGA